MATKIFSWNTGTGNITVDYDGSGDGIIQVSTDPNNLYQDRSAQITVNTTDGSNITRTLSINQAAKVRTDISTATVTAANQTYNGSAKTPTPTVTLNGETIPSSGYDVAYSNNTNAGTATITVTGKNDYTGTATGTFTINQATGQVTTVPQERSVTYNGSSQYLVTSGSGTGTMYYRYKLSTSSTWSDWSTTRPSRTTAGTYNIEYYAAASSDGNYTQSATGSLNATMNKASRTVSFSNPTTIVATSGSVTNTATVSAGSSDGTLTYSLSSTTYATINSSTGQVTAKTSDGTLTVYATISEGTNYLSASGSYSLQVFATVHNFSYSGSVQSLTLPVGSYKLQCWGAQGGAVSGSASGVGSKGGYSEGVLTLSSSRTVYIFVGGQGSSNKTSASAGFINGGWNCGGASYKKSAGSETSFYGESYPACGGGATDIALTTSSMSYSSSTYRNNRSSASLLSRIIVAGGGAGGSVQKVVTSGPGDISVSGTKHTSEAINNNGVVSTSYMDYYEYSVSPSKTYKLKGPFFGSGYTGFYAIYYYNGSTQLGGEIWLTSSNTPYNMSSYYTLTIPSNCTKVCVNTKKGYTPTLVYEGTVETTTYYGSTGVGYGGGTYGGHEESRYRAGQSAETSFPECIFGMGYNALTVGVPAESGAGGAGWYGGIFNNNYVSLNLTNQGGGGSGWVNTAASAGNRPSGYTGLQLDSGTTYAGNTSFPSTSGGTETGHAGNGYARITKI